MATDTKNFRASEFACKCGCGFNVIDQRVINMAQVIRDEVGKPVYVNSGCRCEKRNKACGGVKNSNHTKGLAADLSCDIGPVKLFEAVKKLHAEGKLPTLNYCIRYKWGVHIDCGGKRKNLWEVHA